MILVGIREVPIAKMKLPGDFRARVASQHVIDLAASIEKTGLLNEPYVRRSGMRAIAGVDRIAAHEVNGKKTVRCKLVDCTTEEADEIEATENAHRRHSTEEQREALAKLIDRMAEGVVVPAPEKRKAGRPKTARGMARDMVAAQLGVTPEVLRTQEWREKNKDRPPPPEAPREPCIFVMGFVLDPEWEKGVYSAKESLQACAANLTIVLANLTRLENSGAPLHKARFDRMHEQLEEVSSAIRALSPEMLCPFCKGIEEVTKQCAACEGTQYLTISQVKAVPPVFMELDDPKVNFKGAVMSARHWLAEIPASEPGPLELLGTIPEPELVGPEADTFDPLGDL